MLLESLRLHNFRQYKGEQSITFSCELGKNVTVIIGDNTFGKTTLLQAFNWCFYSTVLLPNPEMLLNYDVAATLGEEACAKVVVEIQLIHSGVHYILTRSQEYIKKNGSVIPLQSKIKVSYKSEDGQTENIKCAKIDEVINSILPKDLSTYFFFDTERVGSVSSRRDLAESVRGLMGLSVLANAIKHIGTKTSRTTVIGSLYGSMDLDGDQRSMEALRRIQDDQARREVIGNQIENTREEISNYEERKGQLYTILRDNQTTSTLQKKKEELELYVSQELLAQKTITKSLLAEYSAGAIHFYSQPLLRRASDFLHAVKVDDKGIKDLTKATLEDIVKRGTCICGCNLSQNSDALAHVLAEMRYVPPESIGNAVRNYRERINNFDSGSKRIFPSIEAKCQEFYRSKTRIQNFNDEIMDIINKIKDKENISKIEFELSDIKKRLNELRLKFERLIREDEACKSEIERFQKIYDGLIAVSDKNKLAIIYINYAEAIYEWLMSTYKEKETLIREELENRVNSIFKKMYHGDRRVVIDAKYQVTLMTTISGVEIESGESEGLSRVKNFAFIAGLVALAKEKIISKAGEQEFGLSSEPYPLVMDAPFSNADETHTSNISKMLPEVAEQVIMFVMQKDWRYAEPVIADRVGSSYRLSKHSEQFSELKGV